MATVSVRIVVGNFDELPESSDHSKNYILGYRISVQRR